MTVLMKSPDGQTTPIWYRDAEVTSESAPPIGSLLTDVSVVGAGIAGLTAAYLLSAAGKSVMVFDEGPVASGQTGRTSGHLNGIIDDGFVETEKMHGLDGAKLAYHSHSAAVDLIEKISRVEGIDCEFVRQDAVLFPAQDKDIDQLRKEYDACRRVGVTDVSLVEQYCLPSGQTTVALRFGNQARFHPVKYMAGLAAVIEKRGVRIYTGCRVSGVTGDDPKKGTRPRTTIDGGETTVDSQAIVVATNTPSPINDWMGIYLKQASYRTYVIALKVPAGSVPDVQYSDTADPYHYVRLDGPEVLLVGGEDHKVGQFPKDHDPFAALERWTRQNFPQAGEVVARWSGQVQEPADYLGYNGVAPTSGEQVYVITGDSGMGLTNGTLGAMLVTDLIQGKTNPWTDLYHPTRKSINGDLIEENANTSAQYGQLFTGGDVKSVDDIAAGSGGVVREGLHKLAVYRRPDGTVHKCSAICTHLKCVVHWNPVESSWDCPCHGSRFDPGGKVLMGPAVDDLPAVG
jgi:glycine/D-amino acid oxidase-like deaminating enzyme/nitrite reductase/ring-hydroxylating ferredoxin subunit